MLRNLCIPCVPLAILLGAGIPTEAGAQPERDELRRVAPGYEDFSPVALSQRLEPVDMRFTLFGEDVYEAIRDNGFGSAERVYMRMYGGVAAIFPRSTYVPTSSGAAATVPPGTIFHLGDPAEALGEAPEGGQGAGAASAVSTATNAIASPRRVDLRQSLAADGRAPGEAGAEARRPEGAQPAAAASIFGSEAQRQRRMAQLLAEAARTEQAAGVEGGAEGEGEAEEQADAADSEGPEGNRAN